MDFRGKIIEIRYSSDEWGPFAFDFSKAIPDGTAIIAVDVMAYEGIVQPKDDETVWSEITSFVEASPTILSNVVYVGFQYPGSAYKNMKATLVFKITLDSAATHPFFYHYVQIR